MLRSIRWIVFFSILISFSSQNVIAQTVYELRKLTEDEWLAMPTEERLSALGTALKHTPNQTFLGDFGRYYELYKRWGYEFYEQEDRYESYAFRDFESYNIIRDRRLRWSYDEFGDRIEKMTYSATVWRERYFGDDTFDVQPPWNFINALGSGLIDGVWLARETTSDWSFSIVGSPTLRMKFTPLTLSLPNMDGISLNFQSENSSAKIISSGVTGIKRNPYGGSAI